MWTFNVVRKLIEQAGLTYFPKELPLDDTELQRLMEESIRNRYVPNEIQCYKFHWRPIAKSSSEVKIIYTYRDVRDALLSWMRFVKGSFDQGLARVQAMMDEVDSYFSVENENLQIVRYDAIIETPNQVAEGISRFLGFEHANETINAVVQAFSREKVKELVSSLALSAPGQGMLIDNLDGSKRHLDKSTLFQSNHITSKAPGEWRLAFSPEQKSRLLDLTGSWLERYKFEV
jgi:hypothetical protein